MKNWKDELKRSQELTTTALVERGESGLVKRIVTTTTKL